MVRLSEGSRALTAFRAEADAFAAGLDELTAAQWQAPTRCTPWRVLDVVGHVITALGRVPPMVAGDAPDQPDTTAIGYYRADHRFSESANAERVRTAQGRASAADVPGLARELTETVGSVITCCRRQPPDRVVRTRHGDAMTLPDFLTTRVVELAVHGLDVADAVRRQPWLTAPAAEHVQQLLFGGDWRDSVATLGWDPVTVLRKSTARAPVTAAESVQLAGLGLRALTLG